MSYMKRECSFLGPGRHPSVPIPRHSFIVLLYTPPKLVYYSASGGRIPTRPGPPFKPVPHTPTTPVIFVGRFREVEEAATNRVYHPI